MTVKTMTVARDVSTGKFVAKNVAKTCNVFYEFYTVVRVGNRIRKVMG